MMGKYKTTRECIHAVNKANDPHELKNILKKYYPDAFINWDAPICKIGQILSKTYGNKKSKYLVVKTVDNRVGLLNMGNNTLWTNFSTSPVMPYDAVSRKAFKEVTNGMDISKFSFERNKK